MKQACQAFVALLVLSLLAGCGEQSPPGTIVTGKIYKGGAPLKVKGTEFGEKLVELISVDDSNNRGGCMIADDGSFMMEGQGAGVKPGKYKIAVTVSAELGGADELKGKFSEKNTPIVREINNSGNQDLGIIDLDKPNG